MTLRPVVQVRNGLVACRRTAFSVFVVALALSVAGAFGSFRVSAGEERGPLLDTLTEVAMQSKLAIRELVCDLPIRRGSATTPPSGTADVTTTMLATIRLEGSYVRTLDFLQRLAAKTPKVIVRSASISQASPGATEYVTQVSAYYENGH